MPGNVNVADFMKVPAPSMIWPQVETARLGLAGKALVMLVKTLSKMSDLVENDIVKSEVVKRKRLCWYSTR